MFEKDAKTYFQDQNVIIEKSLLPEPAACMYMIQSICNFLAYMTCVIKLLNLKHCNRLKFIGFEFIIL